MRSILPININDIIFFRSVESARVEFKGGWDEDTTGYQVLKTICAFSNDLHNLNGGYIIIGVEEENGVAIMPPKGIMPEQIDHIQRWIRGNCNRIDPEYQPVFSPEVLDDRMILVLWVPGSDVRPHRAPDGPRGEKKYWIRIGSETVDAEKNGMLQQLLQLTARVPFDSRRAQDARIEDLREVKVREFLRDVRSGLLDEPDSAEIYRRMRISARANGHDIPVNAGLLLFSDDPEKWFPGVRIEVVQFSADATGNVQEERIFRGGIHEQIRDGLRYLENISTQHLEKQDDSFRVRGWVSYPIPALRETLVNAVYHRSYEGVYEPIKIYLYPDRMEVINYPGPVPGIQPEHLKPGASIPPVPARNRLIGEFLKELRLAEGRGTGLKKVFAVMNQNGSPEPRFEFDPDRTYFRAVLPAHPEYVAITALRDAAHLRALGKNKEAVNRVEEAWRFLPGSAMLSAELMRIYGENQNLQKAEDVFEAFKSEGSKSAYPYVLNTLVNVYVDQKQTEKAKALMKQLPTLLSSADAFDAAILARRLGNQKMAHNYFERAGDSVLSDVRALHEFAQTKIDIARNLWINRSGKDNYRRDTNRRLLMEARDLLERVIQMEAPPMRHAWAWRDLGRVLKWLKAPMGDVKNAYYRAIDLLPEEKRFQEELRHLDRT
ncbi:RNA-binding domain-containing protein [Syntrophomonas wolfei]|uniref:RNA-binding domain-containing protein n=1 Tax=Syntrophomonas wolfei TaxID=863 RepID=UPI0023F385B4|nr:RNA-binding domain-containing protein [Syntrophomonas wolfei]